MAFADTQQLVVELNLKGNLKSGLRGAVSDLRGFDKATSRTQRSLGKFGSNITRGVAVGLAATSAGFLAVVNAASDYESAFAGVRKTVTATEPELQKLSDQFRALSKTIPISAAELARLGEAGGALGIATKDLEEFVRVTALLGVTTDLTSDQAATSLGIIGNVLHLTGVEYSAFASSLVALGNAGASTESQIIAIAERTGAAGELIGLTTAQVLGFSSAVASIGIEPEAGGSALQKFFIETTKFVAAGGDELKLFAKVSGTSAKQFKKNFDKDAGAALQRFLAHLGKLTKAEQLGVLEDLGFNDVRITRTLLGLANNTELVSDQMGVANSAFKENTALTKEADQRFKTFSSQLQITKNVLTDMGITIGSKLLPKLVPLLQKLNAFVSENQGNIEKFGDDLAAGFEKFATAVGKVDWTPFIDGLRMTSDIAKGAISAFQAMPDWLQKLLIAGAVTNKITGGLLTSVTKDLGGAALKLVFERGASPANPLWVQSVGGGIGGPGVPGVPAGPGIPTIVTPIIGAGIVLDKAEVKAFIAEGLAEVERRHPEQGQRLPADPDTKRVLDGIKTGVSDMKADAALDSAALRAGVAALKVTTELDSVALRKATDDAKLGAQNDSSALRGIVSTTAAATKTEINSGTMRSVAAQDAAKAAITAAQRQTEAAVERKNWSVKVGPFTSVTVINGRKWQFALQQQTFHPGQVRPA